MSKSTIGVLVLSVWMAAIMFAYQTGWKRATALHQAEAVVAAQKLKDAVQRASEALSGMSDSVLQDELEDLRKLKEISDAAEARGDTCHLDADRLRSLDAIGD